MDIFAGLTTPKVDSGIQDAKARTSLENICKLLGEMIVKSRKFSGISSTITCVTDTRTNAGRLEKKTKLVTISDGIITTIGTESGWTDCGAV